MECLYCSAPTAVTNSRPSKKTPGVWRRRKCTGCGAIFTTKEQPDFDKSLVIKRGAKLVAFSRDSLFSSIYQACGHRQNASEAASALTATVLDHLVASSNHGVLTRRQVVQTTSAVLKRFDKAAAVQYAAYHPL